MGNESFGNKIFGDAMKFMGMLNFIIGDEMIISEDSYEILGM